MRFGREEMIGLWDTLDISLLRPTFDPLEQIEILQNAGDDISQMNGPSAYIDSYSENKILYKKVIIAGVEVFEYSNNPSDELYNVRFSLVGNNLGNYVLVNNQAVGKIYEYRSAIVGIPQGNYEPIVSLIAPTVAVAESDVTAEAVVAPLMVL